MPRYAHHHPPIVGLKWDSLIKHGLLIVHCRDVTRAHPKRQFSRGIWEAPLLSGNPGCWNITTYPLELVFKTNSTFIQICIFLIYFIFQVVVSKFFLISPFFGDDSHIDEYFSTGRLNHQLVMFAPWKFWDSRPGDASATTATWIIQVWSDQNFHGLWLCQFSVGWKCHVISLSEACFYYVSTGIF